MKVGTAFRFRNKYEKRMKEVKKRIDELSELGFILGLKWVKYNKKFFRGD